MSDGPAKRAGALGGLLRYRADLRTLSFCAAYFAATALAWQRDRAAASWSELVCTSAWLTLGAFQGCVAVHNSAHCPPFTRPDLNACWYAPSPPPRARAPVCTACQARPSLARAPNPSPARSLRSPRCSPSRGIIPARALARGVHLPPLPSPRSLPRRGCAGSSWPPSGTARLPVPTSPGTTSATTGETRAGCWWLCPSGWLVGLDAGGYCGLDAGCC
jgi:hypothetical protein